MPRDNIANLFDILGINSFQNYVELDKNKKQYVASSIKFAVNNMVDKSLKKVKDIKGIKTHFAITRDGKNGWSKIPNQAFLRKLSLYAERSVITFPIHEVMYWNNSDFKPLIDLICAAKPYLNSGYIQILPQCLDGHSLSSRLLSKSFGIISANFSDPDLVREFEELSESDDALFKPLFKHIKSEDVVTIRCSEDELYHIFEGYLHKTLSSSICGPGCEKKIFQILKEANEHVYTLSNKYKKMNFAASRGDLWSLLGFVATGAILSLPTLALPPLVGISTPVAAGILNWIRDSLIRIPKYRDELQKDDYYLVWRLSEPSAKSLDPKAWEIFLNKSIRLKDLKPKIFINTPTE